jgi:uncharacterized membrane protein (UPF0136 family)
MTNPLEQEETATQVLVNTAMMEAPLLIGGVAAYFITGSWIWLVVGIALGGLLWIPAFSKLKRIQERDDASR